MFLHRKDRGSIKYYLADCPENQDSSDLVEMRNPEKSGSRFYKYFLCNFCAPSTSSPDNVFRGQARHAFAAKKNRENCVIRD
jgi:hypothetical protein